MIKNPYVAGNPLKDRKTFFGRENIITDVFRMLRHPSEKAIVLFGQRRIGKTTILLQLDQRLMQEGEYTSIYFDLQNRASSPLNDVLHKLAQAISIRLDRPLPNPELFDRDGEYFRQQFLPDVASFSAPGGLVLLLDEFDVLDSTNENSAGRDFFPYVRTCLEELQNVKFVFVIGRRPEELSTETLSTFKGIRATRVSVLDRKSIESVIRQSENNQSLNWGLDTIESIWEWTKGHTYFTQLLCSVVWERLHEDLNSEDAPTAKPEDVESAIPETLKTGANAFHWIWDGLPPAERVVLAAMAEAEGNVISQEIIEDVLNKSGVRLIVRELKLAPATLMEWEIIRQVGDDFSFAVPLLRYWVKHNRPLIRVKDELDRLNPLAENLFQTGQNFYNIAKPTEAIQQLRHALTVNPNHLKSRLLLGRILLEQGTAASIQDAIAILEEAYHYDAAAAQADLVGVLFASLNFQTSDDTRLQIIDQILQIQPGQPAALQNRAAIWKIRGENALNQKDIPNAIKFFELAGDLKRVEAVQAKVRQDLIEAGDAALTREEFAEALRLYEQAGDSARMQQVRESQKQKWYEQGELFIRQNNLTSALEAYQLIGDREKIKKVQELMELQWALEQVNIGADFEKRGNWEQAVQVYEKILARIPGYKKAGELLENATEQAKLARLYQNALISLQAKDPESAQKSFAQIVAIQPNYRDSVQYMYDISQGKYDALTPREKNISRAKTVLGALGRLTLIAIIWLAFTVCLGVVAIVYSYGGIAASDPNAFNTLMLLALCVAPVVSAIITFMVGIPIFGLKLGGKKKRKSS